MLPARSGPRPRVTDCAPQAQIDQFPAVSMTPALLQRVRQLPGVSFAPSLRAPAGTVGFYLRDQDPRGREEQFMLGQEFAHVHPGQDSSLHMVLPEPVRSHAMAAGWAEPHLLAGMPTVPLGIVLVYAPRDEDELDTVMTLVEASWHNARRPAEAPA